MLYSPLMRHKEIQIFIIEIIHAGHRVPAVEIKQALINRLKRLIPFDMALWASGHATDFKVNNTYLYNLPETIMESWEQIKRQDKLLAGLIANPGKTLDVYDFYTRHERENLATYQQHSKIFGIENAMSTAVPNPDTGLLEILSLYRNDSEKKFSRSERLTKQFVFPLMIEVWHNNQIQHLAKQTQNHVSGPLAICDNRAWIRHAELEFIGLIKDLWPEWTGPVLPEPVAAWLQGKSTKSLKKKKLVLSRTNLNDMTLIQAKAGGSGVALTRREEQIAESFAAGQTYREIAADLTLSPSTVRRHIEAIYKKLAVSNKLQLFQALNKF